MMADNDIIKKALDVLAPLNSAIKNVRLYPPTSASVSVAIDKLYQSMIELLDSEEQIFFSESEKTLLICGHSLSQMDREKPHVISLLNILIGFGLKSITFQKGLEKEELVNFVGLLSRKPESVSKDGGLNFRRAEKIVHILLDQKVYIAVDKDQQIVSNLNITDDQITNFFMLTHPDMDPNSPQFKEMSKNPEALSEAFKTGLSKMMAQKDTMSSIELSESLNNMLSLLDKISTGLDDEKRGILSQHVGHALVAADPAMAEQLTSQNVEYLLGGMLLQYLMAELSQGKLGVADTGMGAGGGAEAPERKDETDDSKSKLLQVADKFGLRLQDARTLLDQELMSVLPKIIEQLIAQKEQESMENLLERLVANLVSENTDVRISAARSLIDIIEHLPDEQKNEIVHKLSGKLLEWFKSENIISPEYLRISAILKSMTQDFIEQKRYPEAIKYLDTFNSVAFEAIGKPDDVKIVCREIIDQLASPENIDILLTEMNSPDSRDHEDAGRIFAALGTNAVDDLLEQLRNNADSNERVRLMHLIVSLKKKALPRIIDQISKEAPWFYLRNLAYLLGQIGNEESAHVLVPLLSHGNDKVRQEALKSIYKTGGDQRGSLLLTALPAADDEFKSSIVEVLGQSKSLESVPALLGLLKNKSLITSAARTNLEEKICTALGTIGSLDAIDPLSEIAATKSFLTLRAYPEKVKAAAAKSLVTLKRKAAGAAPAAIR